MEVRVCVQGMWFIACLPPSTDTPIDVQCVCSRHMRTCNVLIKECVCVSNW